MKLLRSLWIVLATLVLAACGGGGGNPGTPFGGSGKTAKPTLSVQAFDSNGGAVSGISYGASNYVVATFLDANGAPIVGRTVTFGFSGASVAQFLPERTVNATSITDAQGRTTAPRVIVEPLSVITQGASTVTAQTTTSDGTAYSATFDFGVSAAPITLGPIALGATTLDPGGVTSIGISANSSGKSAQGVAISFVADCGTVNAVVITDGNGNASATYSALKADGSSCRGPVTITATANGSTVQKAVLTVTAPVANAINFMSATPGQIFVKDSGAVDQSTVKFKVLDSTGIAMPNVPVVFSLSVNPGGVGLGTSGSTGNLTVNSDANGVATIVVFSGTIPGPVEVKAALASNAQVFTTSKNLTVASGPPSQNHLSLSVETFNIEGWNRDGTPTGITVRVADRQGNPVPDGTVINFTSSGGQIAPSCATKLDAAGHAVCSVSFISQSPRPANGRVAILAFAEGLKEYIDVNGNNVYDAATDTLIDIGDAYRDDNEDGIYQPGEFVVPKGGTVACTGAGLPAPARANSCTGASVQATTVRKQAMLTLSSSGAAISVWRDAMPYGNTSFSLRINSWDHPLLPMPAGTTVKATSTAVGCTVGTVSPGAVPNIGAGSPTDQLGSIHTIPVTGCGGASILVEVTSPAGLTTSFVYVVPAVYVPPPADITPPVFLSVPAVDIYKKPPTNANQARLTVMVNELATGYYMLVPCTSTTAGTPPVTTWSCPAAPSPAALRLSGTPVTLYASTPMAFDLATTPGIVYRVYFIAVDVAGNMQEKVTEATYPGTATGPGFTGP